uniref:Solute carrier organic anion transporter family member n=1 Tax=Phallusia mammillata TaxID=59560 RepID=A0A6F9DTK8_9ASCI|nr:solute carrier organic anion transporter family member 4A1-like [Phallusia mammillata]
MSLSRNAEDHSNEGSTQSPPSDLSPNTVYQFGWGYLQPRCLQKSFNNAKMFLFLLTMANIMQGIIINGLLKVSVTSIERRFNLLSSESGLIVSGYDIAGCLSLLPISYLGGKGHKPRWIGWGLVLTSVGSLVLALPHFLTGPYEYKLSRGPSQSATADFSENLTGYSLCKQATQVIDSHNLSSLNATVADCADFTTTLVSYVSISQMKYVFLFGQFLTGIGCTPLAVLGVTFIDESVDPQVYPMYIGIYYMGALIGPAIGFILGGQLLKVFTDVGTIPTITPDSPQWVGAWWVGFVISAGIILVLSIPVLAYPRKLPSTFTRKQTMVNIKEQQYCSNKDEVIVVTVGGKPKHGTRQDRNDPFLQIRPQELTEQAIPLQCDVDTASGSQNISLGGPDADGKSSSCWPSCELVELFASDLCQVVTNKAFLYLSLAAAVLGTLVSGFSTFGPKFIESQFGKSASDAANLFGYVCIPAGAGGMLMGSVLMSGLKLSYRNSLRMCFCVSLLGLFAQFALTLHCDDIPLAGVNVPYKSQLPSVPDDSPFDKSHPCNAACGCVSQAFDPVCGSDGVTYYSACLAGCLATEQSGKETFTNCSCIPSMAAAPESSTNQSVSIFDGTAVRGKCFKPCWWHNVILVGLFLVISTTFMCAVPGVDLSLRCFPQHLRSLSVGIQWILIRTLGTIPGPIIFGAMIDSTCQIWSQNELCSKGHGSCMVYKNQELSFSLLILSVIYKGASILFFGLTLLSYKPARLIAVDTTSGDSSREVLESPL